MLATVRLQVTLSLQSEQDFLLQGEEDKGKNHSQPVARLGY